jgi:hypothetical protein
MRIADEDIDLRITAEWTNDVLAPAESGIPAGDSGSGALATIPGRCENSGTMALDGPPKKKTSAEDREIEYLMCSQCGTPCYVFETEGSRILEATCLVCGNDEVRLFNLGEEAGPDDD